MAVTAPRTRRTVCAVAHEATYDTAPATSAAMQLFASEVEFDPVKLYVDEGRGTGGGIHPKDTHYLTAGQPTATITMPCSKHNLAFFAEHAMHGQPTASVSGSGLTVANDGGSYLASGLTLTGIRPRFNTDTIWIIYVSVTDGGGGTNHTVSLYSDSARSSLVAQGTANDSSSCTLTEQNDSGLSGSVTLGTISGNDTDITITVASLTMARGNTIDRYFTVWRDSLTKMERITGCTVQKLTRRSEALEAVQLVAEVVGTTYTPDLSTAFTPAVDASDKEIYLHGLLTYQSDVDSDNVTESVAMVEVVLENEIEVDLHNAAKPTAIWKRGVSSLMVSLEMTYATEAHTILQSGIADAWTAEKLTDSYNSKTAVWDFDNAKVIEPQQPNYGSDGWARQRINLECREVASSSPDAPYALTIQSP